MIQKNYQYSWLYRGWMKAVRCWVRAARSSLHVQLLTWNWRTSEAGTIRRPIGWTRWLSTDSKKNRKEYRRWFRRHSQRWDSVPSQNTVGYQEIESIPAIFLRLNDHLPTEYVVFFAVSFVIHSIWILQDNYHGKKADTIICLWLFSFKQTRGLTIDVLLHKRHNANRIMSTDTLRSRWRLWHHFANRAPINLHNRQICISTKNLPITGRLNVYRRVRKSHTEKIISTFKWNHWLFQKRSKMYDWIQRRKRVENDIQKMIYSLSNVTKIQTCWLFTENVPILQLVQNTIV